MTQQEVIKKFMASLDTTNLSGTNALDAAVKACSNFTGIQDAIDHMISDCQNSSSADNFLKDYCGIDLDNDDTGAITGSDAGGNTSKSAEDIVPEVGSLDTDFTDNSFSTNGVTFNLVGFYSDDTTYSRSVSSLTNAQRFIWQGLYTWWAKSALDLIEESYGSNFGFGSYSSTTTHEINFGFDYSNTYLAVTTFTYDIYTGKNVPQSVKVSLNYYNNLSTSNSNGSSSSTDSYLDRTIAHELTHAVMAANIKYFNYLPQFIKEGMAELTHGIDDERSERIKSLAGSYSELKSALNLYNTSTGSVDSYAGGYMFLRYLAKKASDEIDSPTDTVQIFTEYADSYNNYTANTVLSALGGNDSIKNYARNVSINGGSGSDYIYSQYDSGNVENVTLLGDTGNDTLLTFSDYTFIDGGADDDCIYSFSDDSTLSGGKGNDTISLSTYAYDNVISYANGDGNDIIYGFNSNDTLQITGATYSTIKSENSLIITVGEGKITLAGVTSVNIDGTRDGGNIYNKNDNTVITGTTYADDIYNDWGDHVTINGLNGDDYVYNYWGWYNLINGDDGDDIIYNYNGDYSTINGGAGNDKISLSSYTYYNAISYANGDGNDIIYGFNYCDTLQITSGTYSTAKSGNNLIVIVGEGEITLAGVTSANIAGIKDTVSSTTFTNYADNYSNTVANTILSALGGNDTVYNEVSAKNVKIDGGTGDDYILNDAKKVSIIGGTGNDTIETYASNVTVRGNTGNDNIYVSHSASNLKIYADSGNDIVNNFGNSAKIYAGSENDYIYTAGKKVTVNGGSGNDTIIGSSNNDKFYGESGNDILLGGAGNDTLSGGTGNDTLTGDSGKDIFVYSGGNDLIMDYIAGQDKIKISGSIKKTAYKGNNVIFTIGSGTLTVQNGKGKKITINGVTKKYSTKKYSANVSELWFDEENIPAKNNLSEIVAEKSVGEIEFNQDTKLQPEHLITYAK